MRDTELTTSDRWLDQNGKRDMKNRGVIQEQTETCSQSGQGGGPRPPKEADSNKGPPLPLSYLVHRPEESRTEAEDTLRMTITK